MELRKDVGSDDFLNTLDHAVLQNDLFLLAVTIIALQKPQPSLGAVAIGHVDHPEKFMTVVTLDEPEEVGEEVMHGLHRSIYGVGSEESRLEVGHLHSDAHIYICFNALPILEFYVEAVVYLQ